jgi:hypothetical protein
LKVFENRVQGGRNKGMESNESWSVQKINGNWYLGTKINIIKAFKSRGIN